MKLIAVLLFLFFAHAAIAQPFARKFVEGAVILKDGSRQKGYIKWFPNQFQKLQFRETEKGKIVKYPPLEIAGFETDSSRYHSLTGFEVYGDEFGLLGKMSRIKQTFGKVLDTGRFNIYLVLYAGTDGLGGGVQSYPNIIFQDKKDDQAALVAYPLAIRMTEKKYEKAKEKLLMIFKDYPELITQIQAYKREDDFFEIVDAVKTINRR